MHARSAKCPWIIVFVRNAIPLLVSWFGTGLVSHLYREPNLRGLIRNEAGEIHHHVNVYVNGDEVSRLQGLATLLRSGDEVSIIPALAGGSGGCC